MGHSYGKTTGSSIGVCKFGGLVSQGITRAGTTVYARLMKTQIWTRTATLLVLVVVIVRDATLRTCHLCSAVLSS